MTCFARWGCFALSRSSGSKSQSFDRAKSSEENDIKCPSQNLPECDSRALISLILRLHNTRKRLQDSCQSQYSSNILEGLRGGSARRKDTRAHPHIQSHTGIVPAHEGGFRSHGEGGPRTHHVRRRSPMHRLLSCFLCSSCRVVRSFGLCFIQLQCQL